MAMFLMCEKNYSNSVHFFLLVSVCCVFVNNKADPGVTRLLFGMGIAPLPKRLEGPVTQRRRSNTNPHTLLQEADHRVSFYRLVPGRNLVTETGRLYVFTGTSRE